MRHTVIQLVLSLGLAAGCQQSGASSAASTGPDAAAATSAAATPSATSADSEISPRSGPRPSTSEAPAGTNVAHQQTTQIAPTELQEALLERVKTLPGVTIDRSYVSVPGARAFHLDPELARGPREAFAVRTEFGHLHPPHDGSLHLNPEPELRARLIEAGWAEPHPRSSKTVMVYGPRDEEELEVVWSIVRSSYDRATGLAPPTR